MNLEGVPNGMPLLVVETWSEARDRVCENHPCDDFPDTRQDLAKVVTPEGSCLPQLHHFLTEKVESSVAMQWRASLNEVERARIIFLTSSGSKCIHSAIPSSAEVSLTPEKFRTACYA